MRPGFGFAFAAMSAAMLDWWMTLAADVAAAASPYTPRGTVIKKRLARISAPFSNRYSGVAVCHSVESRRDRVFSRRLFWHLLSLDQSASTHIDQHP